MGLLSFVFHCSGTLAVLRTALHTSLSREYRSGPPYFRASAVMSESAPGAFPFLSFAMATSISAGVKSPVLIGRSVLASEIGCVPRKYNGKN